MASKLELRFTDSGQAYSTIIIDNTTFTFRDVRQGSYQVKIKNQDDEFLPAHHLAQEFFYAFQQDKNYLNEFTVNISSTTTDASGAELPAGTYHGIVTIEHPDNTKFDSVANN